MANLTIDQILNECREQNSPTVFTKEASAPSHSPVNKTEIEKMAALLSEASLATEEEPSLYEKIAEAVILTNTIQTLADEGEKLASFSAKAIEAGFDPAEVDAFIEKQAKSSMLSKIVSSPNAKKALGATAVTGLAAGAGAGGFQAGKKKEHKNVESAGLAGFMVGRKFQAAQDQQALIAKRDAIRQYLLSKKTDSK